MMTSLKALDCFRSVYAGNVNIMTPHRMFVDMSKSGKYAIELSTGSGIFPGTTIYGVTVIDVEKMEGDHDLSKGFSSEEEALGYYQQLLQERV
jgi:hypothetical protein